MAGAVKGNKNGIKVKDPDLRQEAYRQYCLHISKGRDKKSWRFIHPTDPFKSLTYISMEKYMRQFPMEFNPILMEVAKADSFGIFEEMGIKLIEGKIRNGSPETWKTFMRNKFGWNKQEPEEDARCAADVILDAINGLI